MAINQRPRNSPPMQIDHFGGLDTFDDIPSDGRCARDLWF